MVSLRLIFPFLLLLLHLLHLFAFFNSAFFYITSLNLQKTRDKDLILSSICLTRIWTWGTPCTFFCFVSILISSIFFFLVYFLLFLIVTILIFLVLISHFYPRLNLIRIINLLRISSSFLPRECFIYSFVR